MQSFKILLIHILLFSALTACTQTQKENTTNTVPSPKHAVYVSKDYTQYSAKEQAIVKKWLAKTPGYLFFDTIIDKNIYFYDKYAYSPNASVEDRIDYRRIRGNILGGNSPCVFQLPEDFYEIYFQCIDVTPPYYETQRKQFLRRLASNQHVLSENTLNGQVVYDFMDEPWKSEKIAVEKQAYHLWYEPKSVRTYITEDTLRLGEDLILYLEDRIVLDRVEKITYHYTIQGLHTKQDSMIWHKDTVYTHYRENLPFTVGYIDSPKKLGVHKISIELSYKIELDYNYIIENEIQEEYKYVVVSAKDKPKRLIVPPPPPPPRKEKK